MTDAAQNSKQVLAQKGTAATPSFSFLGGNVTGMYLAGANQLGFSTAGVNAVTIDASQNVTVTGSFITPTIAGGTTASSTLTLESTTGAGTTDSILFKTGSQSTRMTIDTSGNVGIASGNLTFSGTGQRITGDFSNATIANRVLFQTSTVNGNTLVRAIPNGTSTQANIAVANSSDPANCSFMQIVAGSTASQLQSGVNGTGTYLPMTFYTNGSEQMRIDSSGNVGIGTSSPGNKLTVSGGSIQQYRATGDNSLVVQTGDTSNNYTRYYNTSGITDVGQSNGSGFISVNGAQPFIISVNSSERMRIDSSGNVGIGTVPYATGLFLYKSTAGLVYSDIQNSSTVNSSDGAIQRLITSNVAGSGTVSLDIVKYKSGAVLINNNETNSAAYISFGVGASERMRIDSSGNVGIGTSNPAGYSAKFATVAAGDYSTAATFISNSSAANWARTDWDNQNVAYNGIIYQDQSGLFNIRNDGANAIAFSTNGGNERMRIDSSGNVGIGTTPGTNSNNIQPVTVYSQGPSKLTVKQGTSASPQTGSNSPLIWAQNYIKYDTPSDPFAQNVGGIFADVEIVNDATPGTQINGTWNAIIGNSVNNGVNWGTSTSQNWSTKGSVIGVTGFARANGFPGDSQIVTGLWGYAQGPTLDATTYANLPSGANWSLCGLEVNIQINHPDIGEQSILVGQGSSVGALLSNYRTAGTGVKDWTFGVAYIGSPNDGNYSSTNIDNWNGFYCGILLDKIKAKGIRFGQYFKTGSYGIYFPDSYAGTQEPAAAIYMGNSKINMGQYTGSSFNNQDLWHNGGQLYWKYGGLTFPLMQMASSYTATVTALTGYILVKDDTGAYRKVAVMA